MEEYKLVNKYVLVKPKELDQKIKNIYLSENDRKPKSSGSVIKSSKNAKKVEDGDEVYYYKHSGIKATISGEEYIVLDEDEILIIKRGDSFYMTNERVLVRENDSIKNIGKIILSNNDSKERTSGIILSVDEMSVDEMSVGETAMFSKYSGVYIYVDGEKLKVLNKKEIFIII